MPKENKFLPMGKETGGNNPLFLNFNRPIGRNFKHFLSNEADATIKLDHVHVYEEMFIVNNGDSDVAGLTTMSNEIFMEARRANMSLSPFGHNDPVKFAFAATQPVLLMTCIKRMLAIASHYEFGNSSAGELLAEAAGFDLKDAQDNYSNYCKKFNALVDRINNLYIPPLRIISRWIPHCKYVYRDDEGDRYQYYLYRLSGYYKLDLNPQSKRVGRLLAMPITPVDNQGNLLKISDYMKLISDILDAFEGDDDFVDFATEAIKAGMQRIVMDYIPGSNEQFAKVEFESVYSLDDIMSHENARIVSPIYRVTLNDMDILNWDIYEDTKSGKILIGNADASGVNRQPGKLPVAMPSYVMSEITAADDNAAYPVDLLPITTHGKIKSDEGLRHLLKYVVGISNKQNEVTSVSTTRIRGVKPDVFNSYTSETRKSTVSITTESNLLSYKYLTVYGESVLTGHFVYYRDVKSRTITAKLLNEFNGLLSVYSPSGDESITQYINQYIECNVGFKVKSNLTLLADGEYIFMNDDYDYITTVTTDMLLTYFAKQLWSDLHIMTISDTESGAKEEKPTEK